MKHTPILFALSAAAILTACEKKISEREKMDAREVSALEVQYKVDGNETRSLAFPHQFTRQVVQVEVNNDGLRWNIESDSDWCKVVPEDHRGPGSFTLELEANESFENREPATLTFTAGEFSGFNLLVQQSASAFVISQPYFIAGKDGGSYQVDITTREGVEWSAGSSDSWLTVDTAPASAPANGEVTSTLTLRAGEAGNDSRLGRVTLIAGDEKDVVYLWQFGQEFTWQDSHIFFGRDEAASLSLIAPPHLIREVNLPDYAAVTTETVDSQLDKYTITLNDYLSDAAATREALLSVVLNNNDATVVALPAVTQDYKPAGALLTSAGLRNFAEKVAAGESTSDWENAEGVVTLMQDIDMTGVKDWAGIGTAEHPFAGQFDGKGFAIKKLVKSPNAIFNHCKGAGIKALTIDSSCSFYSDREDWTGGACFGALVSEAEDTRIENCVNSGSVEFSGTSEDDSPAYVGGIIGKGGAGVSLRNCRTTDCTVSVAGSSETAYAGGIAGTAPSIRGCSMSGTLVHEGQYSNLYMGGITAIIGTDETLSGNSFSGKLILKGNSECNYLGGLYGALQSGATRNFDASTDMSTAAGTIELSSHEASTTARVFAGGFLGYTSESTRLSFKGYEVQTKMTVDNSVDQAVGYICAAAFLGGCSPDEKASSLSFEDLTSQGSISIIFGPGNGAKTRKDRRLYGGIAGFANGPATFTRCTNKGDVAVKATGSTSNNETSSNNYNFDCIGGIAGYVCGGDATFTGCINSGSVHGRFYVNNVRPADTFTGTSGVQSAGGILGAFNLYPADDGKLAMTKCDNTGWVNVYRGWGGGVAGFCRNATLTECTSKNAGNKMDGAGNIQGGIAACIIASTIDKCTAKVDVNAGIGGNANDYGSNAGGIVGRVEGEAASTVTFCYYYGRITPAAPSGDKPQNGGGLAGYAPAGTNISNCGFGGEVKNMTVTEAKLNDLAVGAGGAKATNSSLWEGN